MEVQGMVTGQTIITVAGEEQTRSVFALENGAAFFVDAPKSEFQLRDVVMLTITKA